MARLIIGRRVASKSPPSPEERVLRLEPTEDFSGIAERLAGASRVEVNFPKFGDGRGYSIARLLRERYGYRGELRERYGYRGELRAVGQFTRDHLQLMERVGFDAYELREGEDAEEALAAFDSFSAAYQK